MAPWELALAAHEYLTTHIRYDYARYSQGIVDSEHPEAYTAAGALIDGEAVCAGYAKAYQLLMKRLGVECVEVSIPSHSWNMVRFSPDGPWYHVDVTWDDPYWDTLGRSCHDYFLLSDAELLALDPQRAGYSTNCITPDGSPAALVPFDLCYPFWKDTKAQCCFSGGSWYYIDGASKQLKSYIPCMHELNALLELPNNTWKEWGERGWNWTESYSRLLLSGGSLYFNTCSDIRRYDPRTQKTDVIAEIDTTEGYIYGFGEYKDGVGYVLRKEPCVNGPETITLLTGHLWDVEPGAWYTPAVEWAVEREIVTSDADGRFRPDEDCTRGEMVAWLWRQAGSPAPTTQHRPFRDVPANSKYDDAVLWAWEKGYVNGMSEDTFAPDGVCTRAQAVTILNRVYSRQFPGYPDMPHVVFRDVDYNAWYAPATIWALQAGLVTSMGDSTFGTELLCSRAQMITMLCRADTVLNNQRRG